MAGAVMVVRSEALPAGLAEAADTILGHRIARAHGRGWRRDDGGLAVAFGSPLAALRCALRITHDMALLTERAADPVFGHAIGIAAGEDEAARIAAGIVDGIAVSAAVRAAVEGEVDVIFATGADGAVIATPMHQASGVFHFKPWTSPRRRRIGLAVAGALVVLMVIGLALTDPG